MPDESVKDFFISYNQTDRSWAEWIGWELEEAKYTVVLQAWDFRPGSNFVLDMQKATALAERTIAVLSPDYLNSSFTQPEWAAAFAQDPTGEKGILLPVRVRECDPKGLLPQIVYIDLVALNEIAAREALLKGVQRGRAKPSTKPGYPATPQRTVLKQPRFPNTLPPVWNVPHNQNRNFTGRVSLLNDLKTSLHSGQPAALTQAIHGLGGVGKTQTAVQYAYSNMADYDVVWWMRAEEPTTLAADYAGLAGELGLPEKDAKEQSAIVKAVRNWLGHNRGWLLVFDNAVDQASVRGYLPSAGAGHVLITSRDPNWRGVASPFRVTEMERPVAVAFLLKRTGLTDETTASSLAEELGDLPLALEQAGAYIEETSASFSDYLTLFKSHRQKLLHRGSSSTDYPDTVATTWEISFQQVKTTSPLAEDLMNLCAFFAPDDIPLSIISEGTKHLPASFANAVRDPIALNEAIAALRHYSLAEVRDNSFISMHRLVQMVMRDRLDEDARKTWAEAAVNLVNSVFPLNSDDVRTWPLCSRLLPHALVTIDHARLLQVAYESIIRLLNQLGVHFKGRGEFAEARATYEQSLALGEAYYGGDHHIVGTVLSNLGNILESQGDFVGARDCQERSLAIAEKAYGTDHPTVAIRLNNLGNVLQSEGDFAGAQSHFERALAITEKAYGGDHPSVAIRLNNLGGVLLDQGDFAGARAHYQRALEITEKAYGADHPSVAIRLNNLGDTLHSEGDFAGAQSHFERALAITEKAYGGDHPSVAIRLNNLGGVLFAQGDFVNARPYFERAIQICRKFLGENHPYTLTVQRHLAALDYLAAEKDSGAGGET